MSLEDTSLRTKFIVYNWKLLNVPCLTRRGGSFREYRDFK